MLNPAAWYKRADVSEDHTASIFNVNFSTLKVKIAENVYQATQ
jgi:hypothetical protein